jgi:tetratricopeptide (TPR) repeat protein
MINDEALQQAARALNAGRPQEAERISAEVLKINPNHSGALHVIGYALLMQRRFDDAVAMLKPVARRQRDAEFDTQLAIALRGAGRDGDAMNELKRAIKRKPPYAPAFVELGDLLTTLKRHDEAIDTLRHGLDVAPMLPELSIQLGYALLERRRYAEAKAAFARALAITPDRYNALFGMAKTLQQLGECEVAADYFRRCLMIHPDNAELWLDLGQCLLEAGQRDAGYECFRTAARGDAKHRKNALSSLVRSGRGRFWLKPSAATRYLLGTKS